VKLRLNQRRRSSLDGLRRSFTGGPSTPQASTPL
jgi:hypothetical protein